MDPLSELPDDLVDADYFADTLRAVYGAERAADIAACMSHESLLAYWVNPLLEPVYEPADVPVAEMPGMWQAPRDGELTTSAAAESARIYIQNPASFLAVTVLAPAADEEVLDLAAAPGGKTIAMAARMGNSGRIAAVEPVKKRFHRLRANLARCGVHNAALYQKDGRGVGRVVPERFDRVLLDAPCSSEARMRWSEPGTYTHWSRRKVKEAQRKQKSLLRSAYAALKPGGVLLYSTCSFSPEENELVVAHLLARSDATLLPIMPRLPEQLAPQRTVPGVVEWRGKSLPQAMSQTIRVVPDQLWSGFFMALLTKPGGTVNA